MQSKVWLWGALLLCMGVLSVPLAYAAEIRSGDEVVIRSTDTVTDDVYAAGGSVTSEGRVNGDLIAVGGNLLVGGDVTGDLALAGGSVTVTGTIGDDARLTGGNVAFSGSVGDDLMIGGGQVSMLSGAVIGGDVRIAGGRVVIDGTVEGSVTIGAGEVVVNGVIAGDVQVYAGTVTVGPNARIGGQLVYEAEQEATIDEGATITGGVAFNELSVSRGEGAWAYFGGVGVLFVLGMLLVGVLLFGKGVHSFTENTARRAASSSWWKYLLLGLVMLIVIPFAAALLFATILGAPLGALALLGYIALIIVSWFYAAIILGSVIGRMTKRFGNGGVTWASLILGAFVYVLLGLIPFLGQLIQLGFFLMALGALGVRKWEYVKALR